MLVEAPVSVLRVEAQGLEEPERRPAMGQHPGLRHDLVVLGVRPRVPRDPAPDAVLGDAGSAILHDRADRDVEPSAGSRRAGGRQVADRSAVRASGGVLEVGDQLHRPDLGCARHAPAREQRAEDVPEGAPLPELGRDGRGQLPHRLEPLRLEHLAPPNRPDARHPSEIVPQQIHDHRVLGALLDRTAQPRADRLVLREPATARRGALHRLGRDRAPVDPEEQLRGGREDAVPAEVEVRRVGTALRVAEVAIEALRVAGDAGAEPEREVDLIGVARRDVVMDPLDRGVVRLAIDRRSPGACRWRRRLVRRSRERRFLARLEQGEPCERELGERIGFGPRPDPQRRVEARSCFVGHHPGDPEPPSRGRLRGVHDAGYLRRSACFQHADRLHQAEARLGAAQVVEARLDHALHDT